MPAVGLLEHWYIALRSQAGARVRVVDGDLTNAKAKLYKVRADAMDERLASLSITESPTASDELWIIHSSKGNSSGT